jgi:hypothetical protein
MMHKELTQMSNDLLIEMAKASIKDSKDLNSYRYLTELITRFERLSLGKQADEAIQKLEELQEPTLETSSDLVISTIRPVKKVQENDEVEALAEKFWLLPDNPTLENCFKNAERFINQRNERRGKNAK